jgi:DNA-binding transcriptional ArsR family regulator
VADDERPIIDLDARTLRGLAHPLRVRILALLDAQGPMTASGLAQQLGELTGTTSWHLRQLAAYGFIRDVPERGNKRERWWEPAGAGVRIDSAKFLTDPRLRPPALVFLYEVIERDFQRAARFLSEDWPKEWHAASMINTFGDLHLSPTDLQDMRRELFDIINRYRNERQSDDPGARRVVLQIQAVPIKEDKAE